MESADNEAGSAVAKTGRALVPGSGGWVPVQSQGPAVAAVGVVDTADDAEERGNPAVAVVDSPRPVTAVVMVACWRCSAEMGWTSWNSSFYEGGCIQNKGALPFPAPAKLLGQCAL